MSSRSLTSALAVAIVLISGVLASSRTRPSAPAAKTTPAAETWTPPKTPWGDPDLQGIYTSDDYMNTPLERPSAYGERLYFTEGELAEAAVKLAKQPRQSFREPFSGIRAFAFIPWGTHDLIGESGRDGRHGKHRSSWIRRTEKCLR